MIFFLIFGKINVFTKSEVKKMPNIKSAKKRVRSNGRKEKINTYVSSSMKTAIKKSEKAIKTQDKALAEENLKVAIKRIDKAVASGLIHKNKAAREKSRLTKQTNALN